MTKHRRSGITALLGLTGCVALAACSNQKSEADTITSPIWTEQSRAIDVNCFGFFDGSKRIRATRDQLSADQLGVLSNLTLIRPTAQCYSDTNACRVAITATDGTVATYTTEALDDGCGKTDPVIAYDSFTPFLQSIPCLSAKEGLYGTGDAGATIPSIRPDARCYDGVFTLPPETVPRLLVVEDPSIPRHLEFDACNDTRRSPAVIHPQLLALDGTTPLPVVWVAVTTDPGADGTCYRADYTFPAAGSYVLSIGTDTGFTAGDFFVRFY
jgi:hypothetical protein